MGCTVAKRPSDGQVGSGENNGDPVGRHGVAAFADVDGEGLRIASARNGHGSGSSLDFVSRVDYPSQRQVGIGKRRRHHCQADRLASACGIRIPCCKADISLRLIACKNGEGIGGCAGIDLPRACRKAFTLRDRESDDLVVFGDLVVGDGDGNRGDGLRNLSLRCFRGNSDARWRRKGDAVGCSACAHADGNASAGSWTP